MVVLNCARTVLSPTTFFTITAPRRSAPISPNTSKTPRRTRPDDRQDSINLTRTHIRAITCLACSLLQPYPSRSSAWLSMSTSTG